MATETEAVDRRESHVRSITVTTVASLAGVAAGLVSWATTPDPASLTGVAPLAAFALGELALLRALGVDVTEFSTKDNLFVFFMTFALWFITWTILLTSGVSS